MYIAKGHGASAATSQGPAATKDMFSMAAAVGMSVPPPTLPLAAAPPQTFGYYFPDAPDASDAGVDAAALDALAVAMAEPAGAAAGDNSNLPPIITYLGQFIDHDVTAGTDADFGVASILGATITPASRAAVVAAGENLRHGSLNLDSLYGDLRVQTPFGKKLQGLLRFPRDRRMMWIARPSPVPGNTPLPADGAGDILRLGRLMSGTSPLVTPGELQALLPGEREHFLDGDGNPKIHRAIIGDSRNDENLIVAQLHLAFLRFHNRLAVTCEDGPALEGGPEGVFRWAQRQARLHYQWLVVNEYLPAICDPVVLDQVVAGEAPLYRAFRRAANVPADIFPLPIEFSAAAFRFGHSMVRAAYDHNRFFGEGNVPNHVLDVAPFELLFTFTGNGRPPMGSTGTTKLPSNWVIEWDRFVFPPDDPASLRAARKIDTRLAPPLLDMRHIDHAVDPALFQHLARRNLRRGLALNLPAAQDCISILNRDFGAAILPLTDDEHRSSETGVATPEAMIARTPLWFYVLKEAEVRGGGNRLGPLGSHLVAQTLVGLIVEDADSYWHAPAVNGPKWQPGDDARPDGILVDSFEDMLRAALVL